MFPAGGGVAIAGVNGGLPFAANPCLASELAWAGAGGELYANTADPGPLLSSHWPNGQTSPQQCNTTTLAGADTASCAYDYGWNAAADSYADAVAGYIAAGLAPAGATATPGPNTWWLDVETDNSWEPTVANNLAELQGEVDYLKSVGAATVGFYAPPAAWATVIGSSTMFSAQPFWLPGAASFADAQARCARTAPNGGQISLVQFPQSSSVNADLVCAAVLTLHGTPAKTAAGKPSPPLTVRVAAASTAPVTISLTSSSATGHFSLAPAGPWMPTLALPIHAGALTSESFYYQDSSPGTAELTAAANNFASATGTVTVTSPVCTVPPQTDHGPEIAVAHLKSITAATRDAHTVAAHIPATRIRARIRIERDTCTDYELAIGGLNQKAAATLLHQLRPNYPHATVETR
jgi:hypothetical protein